MAAVADSGPASADTRAAWRLAAVFFLLALWLAWFVTPHGDIPDESGHYAYVQEIADRGSLPLLGKATMARDMWRDVDGLQGKTRPNYIAQHPPLYYAVAAIPYRILHALTDRKDLLPKAPRLVSALALGLTIGLLVLTLREAGASLGVAMAVAASFGLLPLVPHLASGISNDIFLTLLAAGATLSLVRYISGQGLRHAYACAVWLACAGATKMTAWVLIAAYMALLLWELRKTGWSWLRHAVGLGLVSLSTSLLWMARNLYHFDNPFYVYGSDFTQKVFNTSHWDYLAGQTFFDQLFGNLYASVGFSGYCQSPTTVAELARLCQGIRIMAEDRLGVAVFATLCALTLLVVLTATWRALSGPRQRSPLPEDALPSLQQRVARAAGHHLGGPLPTAVCTMAGIATALAIGMLAHQPEGIMGWMHVVPALLLLAAAPACLALAIGARQVPSRLLAYGVLSLLLIALLVFHMGYKSYLINGYPRGLQGRYLLPFLPLMLVSVGVAIQRCRHARGLAMLMVSIMAGLFLHTYVGEIIPFFQSVRI